MGATWNQTINSDFPDVFDPAWATRVQGIAQQECAPRKDDKFLLGYFIDNELNWGGSYPRRAPFLSSSLLTFFLLRLDELSPGHREAVAFLRTRYQANITLLNAAWHINASSFETISDLVPLPSPPTSARSEDDDAFQLAVADRYFNVTSQAIRRNDPNHMILGYRSSTHVYWPVVEAAAKWKSDAIDIHAYTSDPPLDTLQAVYNRTRIPLMVSEFGFRASDSGLPNTQGAGPVVATQTERAAAYRRYITQLVALPYVVGFHQFAWVDEPGAGRLDGEDSNYGLVHLDDDPYTVLVEEFTKINRDVPHIHRYIHTRNNRHMSHMHRHATKINRDVSDMHRHRHATKGLEAEAGALKIVGWYDLRPGYVSALPPTSINFTALTHLVVGGPSVATDGTIACTPYSKSSNVTAELRQLATAHQVSMQWVISDDTAKLLNSSKAADTFVAALPDAVRKCECDGIEFDYEPGDSQTPAQVRA